MHIVLDLQACQSPEGRRRGIGRYSLALAKAMARHARDHQISVLLNAAMAESVEFLRGQFDDLLPQAQLVTWEALAPTGFNDPANGFRRGASEALRLQAIRRLKPDFVHVASLFDGFADEVIGTLPAGEAHLSAVTLYDLIPLAHQETYLREPRIRSWYMEKVEHLRHADVLLGISQFSCDEAVELLQIPRECLTDISGAADDMFVRLDNAEAFRQELMHRYGLERPFVMYAGGFDVRKNIGALIRAFALLTERAALGELSNQLGLGADEVVFTGYVPDSDLVKLYNLCALYVFPSLQEGFGLPALEAMSSGAIVIGADTSSLPEVIGYAGALFDPRNDHAIAAKMVEALTDDGFRANLRRHAEEQCRKFSWKESARRAIDAFEAADARRERARAMIVTGPVNVVSGITALLPAPGSTMASSLPGTVVTYANRDCAGVSATHSLARFVRDRKAGRLERVVLELADDPYCAKTLGFAASGAVDIRLLGCSFGAPLRALARTVKGREIVVSMLYRAGGYAALRAAVDGGFSQQVLGTLVTPHALTTLGRSQVLPEPADADAVMVNGLSWRDDLSNAIAQIISAEEFAVATARDWSHVAVALSCNMALPGSTAQWLVDISNLAIHDAGTGIQRVVRHVLDELIASPPPGYRVEPVCLGDDGVFRYARRYCQQRYFEGELLPSDEPVEFASGDIYLGLDLVAHLIPAQINVFRQMRNRGVRQYFVLYDLLPLLRPDCFDPPGLPLFRTWYESIAEVADGIVCISRAVADEFESWLHQARPERHRPLNIGWFHLGADMAAPSGTQPTGAASSPDLPSFGERPTFLMVGTIEPRKGHAQTLAAFEQLWRQGIEANLLVIGKPGWLVDELICRIKDHPQRGQQLFWLDRADDATLLAAYKGASALIMASEGEGFGLPLIEAAHHGLALIARDLPVFREIAAEHAHYFSGHAADDLRFALEVWLDRDAAGTAPPSIGMQWNTWREATIALVDVIGNQRWAHRWMAGPVRRYGAFDYRFHTQVGRLVRGRMTAGGEAGFLLHGPYVPLSAGRYAVQIYGGGSATASMDVCSSSGVSIHVQREFVVAGVRAGQPLVQVELLLDADVADLEVRVWVSAGADLWLDRIEIHPLPAATVAIGSGPPDDLVVAGLPAGENA
jgi:glycosyltransferase involved in cell wall biosynthesis